MGKRIFLKQIITVILVLIIIFGVMYYIKTISQPQFKINLNPNTQIFFSEKRKEYYVIENGNKVYISITRDNYPAIINEFDKNNRGTVVFSMGSFDYSKYTIVAYHIVFVSPDNKVKARRIYGIVDDIEWIDNKTLKVNVYSIKNGESITYIKDPFNLTIFERIIEEGKELIAWINHKGWR
ncbi:hypothetical protein [Halocella sp. SP3-1]|uniref:hypothetical protein n=1 Tax=Halocella sp. SP3-1 TaxID=2382161 RepID=UPI000F750392|nr:hypothetical protein [Halocella sp. SP3-1]AZO94950.1 hypothetical protein D7D81_10305 [Halocella sp. SP3-1]